MLLIGEGEGGELFFRAGSQHGSLTAHPLADYQGASALLLSPLERRRENRGLWDIGCPHTQVVVSLGQDDQAATAVVA